MQSNKEGVEMTEGTNQNQNEPDGSNVPNPDGGGASGTKIKTYTEEEYKSVVSESIGRRKELEEYKAKLKAIEDEKLSEAEKKEKKVKELEAEIANIRGSVKAKEIDNLILKSMAGKNFIDNEAVELLIKRELESVEEITAESVSKITEKLIKDKPQLIASNPVNPSDGNFAKQGGEATKTGVDALASLLSKYKG
jgi:alanyl-tRNA synthetase